MTSDICSKPQNLHPPVQHGQKLQAVIDIQLAYSTGERRLAMARMLERVPGAEGTSRTRTHCDPCECANFRFSRICEHSAQKVDKQISVHLQGCR